jgi:hypothetical protein
VSIGSWAAVELRAMDGTGDRAATAIAAVKPCAAHRCAASGLDSVATVERWA